MAASAPVRAIVVVGLGHSGSTLLERALATPGVLSLGEARSVVRLAAVEPERVRATPCACGAPLHHCPLWAPVVDEAARQGPMSDHDGARLVAARLVDAGAMTTGPDGSRWVVDGSKDAGWATGLRDAGVDVQVVRLRRDARPWALARHRRRARVVPGAGARARVVRAVEGSRWRSLHRWHQAELATDRALTASALPVVAVTYEALASAPAATLAALRHQLALPTAASPADEGRVPPATGHAAFGNALGDGEPIALDERWRHDRWLRLAWLAAPAVRRHQAGLRVG